MSLSHDIRAVYPELTPDDFEPQIGCINLRNDGDGQGDYISKWEYSKPLPAGMVVGKPNE